MLMQHWAVIGVGIGFALSIAVVYTFLRRRREFNSRTAAWYDRLVSMTVAIFLGLAMFSLQQLFVQILAKKRITKGLARELPELIRCTKGAKVKFFENEPNRVAFTIPGITLTPPSVQDARSSGYFTNIQLELSHLDEQTRILFALKIHAIQELHSDVTDDKLRTAALYMTVSALRSSACNLLEEIDPVQRKEVDDICSLPFSLPGSYVKTGDLP